MAFCGVLRRGTVLALAVLALCAATVQGAAASSGCPAYALSQPFLPWLDPASYTLAPNGGLERGSTSWTLSGGASVASDNEPFFVGGAGDSHSLALPAGSSATTDSTCVTLADATMRMFVQNTGSLLSTLKVDVLYTDSAGTHRSQTIALLTGTRSWQPTPETLLLANLLYPPLLTDGHVDVAFRFTPQGSLGGWRIDDVYVDPLKGS
jgi:hypothetical protein